MNNNITPQFSLANQQRIDCLTISLLANTLWKNRNVLCLFYGHSLVDEKIEQILFYHQQSIHSSKIKYTLKLIKEISVLPQLPSMIDIGELAEHLFSNRLFTKENLIAKLWKMSLSQTNQSRDVVLYGFGRIGRLLARELCTDLALGMSMKLKAVVTRDPVDADYLRKRASLLMKDSIHGSFKGTVTIEEESNSLIINNRPVKFISAQAPQDVDYWDYGIVNGLLIDNTGKYRNQQDLQQHLTSKGISQVIVTAPAKDVPNIVYGVNDQVAYEHHDQIFSTASCTTNAITPVLDLINKAYGIEKGHIETIHAYTNDQNLVDNMHAKSRRGRAALLNMVITETGAGNAVAKVIPELAGKFTSSAIRVPIANGSLAILILELKEKVSLADVHLSLQLATLKMHKHQQIAISKDEDLVSTDIIGNSAAGIIDTCASSISNDGKTLTLYVWYDNEYGYSMQVLGFADALCKHASQQVEENIMMVNKTLASSAVMNN